MRNVIIKIWQDESEYGKWFLLLPLFCISRLYRFCLLIRNSLYDWGVLKTDEVSIPVLAIGNITVGGTGKTPLVEKLAFRLKEMGFNPGIITRGYKRTRQGTFCIDRNNDKATEVGDEALMLARKTKIPVVVGTRRALAVVEAMRKCSVDLAILDDGFQVRNIRKNVEIVVVKGGERNKSTDLFPLGPCREPMGRLRDADAVLLNNGSIGPEIADLLEGIPTFKMSYRPVHLYNMKHNLITHYNTLNGKKVLAFSGLGDNMSFFELLRSLGAHLVREFSFQDHHVYRVEDIEKISSFHDVNLIVTTEKDAVKISEMTIPDNLFYLSIEVNIENEKELIEVILKKIEFSGLTLPRLGTGNQIQKYWAN
jgi:tetraacyldisaccharide 4'-kinase